MKKVVYLRIALATSVVSFLIVTFLLLRRKTTVPLPPVKEEFVVKEKENYFEESAFRRAERRGILSLEKKNESALVLLDGTIVREPPSQGIPSWPEPGESCRNVANAPDEGERLETFVDDRGFVCTRWALDTSSGCCISRRRYSMLGCRPDDGCCDRYVFCVSRCSKERAFDVCLHACRPSSRTFIYEFDLPEERKSDKSFRYCYEGKRSAPAIPASPPEEKTLGKTSSIEWVKF